MAQNLTLLQPTLSSDRGYRLLLQGPPGSGKTTACLTFPKPLFINIDNNLPDGCTCIQIWKPEVQWELCRSIGKSTTQANTNLKDALLYYTRAIAPTLPEDVTLIYDSMTMIDNAATLRYTGPELTYNKSGQPDTQKAWGLKLNYYYELFQILKTCRCKVVVTAHETPDRGEDGELNGQLKPLMSGGFKDQLGAHFTDIYRQRIVEETKDGKKITAYKWQLKPTAMANCKTSFQTDEQLIPASWAEVEKRRNKNTNTQ